MLEKSWLSRLEASRPYQWLRFAMNRKLARFLLASLDNAKGGLKIAEVACGSGYVAHLLAQEPGMVLSIAGDISLEDYVQARIENYQASFVLMDIFNPAVQSDSMDLVWNSSSLEELENPLAAIASMARITKPGGSLFVGVPNRFGLAGLLSLIPDLRTRKWLGKPYTRNELRRLIESSGLRAETEISYLFGIFLGVLARKSL